MNKFKFICVILIFVYTQSKPNNVNAKRVSELKCDETASLLTEARSKYPYLVEIVHNEAENYSRQCLGALISEDYVLVNANCITRFQNSVLGLIIRKFILPEEQYSNSQVFSVKRVIKSALPDLEIARESVNIALIQSDFHLFFQQVPSVFRPACLWSDVHEPLDTILFGYQGSELMTKSFTTLTTVNSALSLNSTNFMLFNTSSFDTLEDSPVYRKIGDQHYIAGIIVSRRNIGGFLHSTVLKIDYVIDWIESIVWPNISSRSSVPATNSDASLSSLQCGYREKPFTPLIAIEQPTYNGEFAWHIALLRDERYICGGTIISSLTILTAAHCVHDENGVVPDYRFTVLAGTHTLIEQSIDARNYFVRTVIVHENYNSQYLENDITLLKLTRPIEFSNFIQPICLSNMLDYSKITMGLVAGWGQDEHNQQSNILLKATLSIIDEFTCLKSNRGFYANYLNPHNYCAGYRNGTNVCSGVSGGAMIIEYNSQWYIKGIVSLGAPIDSSDQCDTTEYVIFTDVPKYYEWIRKNLEDEQ